MAPGQESEPREDGEWDLFVSRAVLDVQREFGEDAADRIAALLLAQKAEALEVDRRHLATTQHLLEQALEELEEARSQRDARREELAALEAEVDRTRRELETEAARSEERRIAWQAELDAQAAVANERLAGAWAELREHEAELATRRADVTRIEDVIAERLAEAESRLIEADNMRAAATADRQEAQRLVDEATRNWQAAHSLAEGYTAVRAVADAAASAPETVIELRELARTGEAQRALDERDHELREWEAELVRRTQELDLREDARRRDPRPPSPSGQPGQNLPPLTWGRGRRRR